MKNIPNINLCQPIYAEIRRGIYDIIIATEIIFIINIKHKHYLIKEKNGF